MGYRRVFASDDICTTIIGCEYSVAHSLQIGRYQFLPAPCTAWAGYASARCPSVCLSGVTLMYAGHISWATSNFITGQITTVSQLFALIT